jgi:hypothetical protein
MTTKARQTRCNRLVSMLVEHNLGVGRADSPCVPCIPCSLFRSVKARRG